MQRCILIILLSISISGIAGDDKDKSKEIGVAGGTAYYLGEINRTHFGGELKLGGGVFYRQNFDRRWSLNLGVNYLEIGAFDSKSSDPWKVNRNLHFRNQMLEVSALAELNFFPYQIGSKQDWISPYLSLGFVYYNMNPQAQGEGGDFWRDLQPLGTEGQGTTANSEAPYNLAGLAVTYGFGLKMNITGRLAFNVTYGMRSASTDYLDDVSTTYADPAVLRAESSAPGLAVQYADRSIQQIGIGGTNAEVERGDPTNNDFYAFTTFALTFKIDKKPSSCWGGR